MRTIKVTLFGIVSLSIAALQGCGSSDPTPAPPAVTMQKVNGIYYMVDVNMSAVNHYDFGRQYALQIKNNVPDYGSLIDSNLHATIELLKEYDPTIDFDTLSTRAHAIYDYIPTEYQQEIQGMQSVFSDTDDEVGNGRLSQNKLLVYELAPDVGRLAKCSASAAFGTATTNGKTILGRNLEWTDETRPYLSALHAVVILHNANKSLVLFGFLGQLCAVSGFNTSNVFAAILDSDVTVFYWLDGDERSYAMDLRYALENQTSIQGVADYLTGKDYAYDFNIFLADQNSAAVFEDDIHTPFSGLRTATSTLQSVIPAWNYSNAIACVNWFSLPGAVDNHDFWEGNLPRWNSFINLYGHYLSQGKITIDVVKQITAYLGTDGKGKAYPGGAIWRYDDYDSEMQSIIISMDTLETWISFQPAGAAPLHSPNYIQVFSSSPF